jgi:hypothetical protein
MIVVANRSGPESSEPTCTGLGRRVRRRRACGLSGGRYASLRAAGHPVRVRAGGFVMPNLEEYVEHLTKTSTVIWVDGTAWERSGEMLRPIWMPHQWKRVDRRAVRDAVARTGAVLAQWSEGWDTVPCGWWYVCCDDPRYDVSRLQKGPRYDVRRGLAECEVGRLDPDWFSHNGFPVYQAAYCGWGIRPPLSEAGFFDETMKQAGYAGRETWGAFIAGILVAWESCLVVGDASMSVSAKSNPAYHRSRPNNALVYVLTRHYLRDRGMKYHGAGSRVLLHPSNVQAFQERMGYRKVHSNLRVALGWKGALASASRPQSWPGFTLPGRVGSAVDRLRAFGLMMEIARSCAASNSSCQTDGTQ